MKYCSKCGNSNVDDAAFCAQCGTALEQAPQASGEPTPSTFFSAPAQSEAPASGEPAPGSYNTDSGSYFTDPSPSAHSANGANVYNAPPAAPATNPNTLWLILNIVATVLCCCFFSGVISIVGIVFAGMGMSSFNRGDYEDSAKKANIAKILFIVSVALGALIFVIALVTGLFSTISNSYGYNFNY